MVLGTRVTVISNHIVLRTFDDDVRDAITKRIKSPLINIVTDYDFLEFSKDEVIYKSLGETYKLKPDYVVIATGYGVNQEVLGDVVWHIIPVLLLMIICEPALKIYMLLGISMINLN